jgi:hypothetical protein
LEHHHVGLAGGAQPDDVAVAQNHGFADAAVVHVDAARAARVVDGDTGRIDDQTGVEGAHAGEDKLEVG